MLLSLPGAVMGFREGLEAFLVAMLIWTCLGRLEQKGLRKYVGYGVISGIAISLVFGALLYSLGAMLNQTQLIAKIWESVASVLGLGLVTTFLVWMIKHGRQMTKHVTDQVAGNLSSIGIFGIAVVLIAREGVEIAIFSFAGKFDLLSVFSGISVALIVTFLISKALLRVDLNAVFNVTLAYLVLQAGYLLGYGIHEGLSALKDAGYIAGNSFWLIKAFDLSKTSLEHKEGWLGLPLNVLFGWYSRPEWVQLVAQVGYVTTLSALMASQRKNTSTSPFATSTH